MNQLPIRPPGHPGQQRVAGPVHLHRDGWLPRLPHARHLWPQRLWLRLLPQWKRQVSYRWFCALSRWLLCWHRNDVGYLMHYPDLESSASWKCFLLWAAGVRCFVAATTLVSLRAHASLKTDWVISCLVFTGLFFYIPYRHDNESTPTKGKNLI